MTDRSLPPVFDANSKVLILGSFPSIKSYEAGFYYSHPQNRFWKVLAAVFGEPVPDTVLQKRELLLRRGIALWDVIANCDVVASADSSIANVCPVDLDLILSKTKIQLVYLNGRTAEKYYNRYLRDKYGLEGICLPSTSPANASWTLPRLVVAWRCILESEQKVP